MVESDITRFLDLLQNFHALEQRYSKTLWALTGISILMNSFLIFIANFKADNLLTIFSYFHTALNSVMIALNAFKILFTNQIKKVKNDTHKVSSQIEKAKDLHNTLRQKYLKANEDNDITIKDCSPLSERRSTIMNIITKSFL